MAAIVATRKRSLASRAARRTAGVAPRPGFGHLSVDTHFVIFSMMLPPYREVHLSPSATTARYRTRGRR